jgi:uncharacterized membrane protein
MAPSLLRRFEARRLDAPRRPTRFEPHYDPEAFGRLSEGVARFFGTARFLVIQTIVVSIWIALNVFAVSLQWDPYPFILLNLVFSTQAAYAAPLILLAQNRQAERDRLDTEEDRRTSSRTQADAEFLAREIMAARMSLGRIEATVARLEEDAERERRERDLEPQ